MNIKKELNKIRLNFAKENKVNSYLELNNGLCSDFADEVYYELKDELSSLTIFYLEDFYEFDSEEEPKYNIFDLEIVRKLSNNTEIPLGLNKSQLEVLELNFHVWVMINGLHYDAECISGAKSFFDLPIYKRVFSMLEKFLIEKDLVENKKITTDDTAVIKDFKEWFNQIEIEYMNNNVDINEFWKIHCPDISGYELLS